MESSASDQIHALFRQLIDAWNNRNARGMAEQFTEKGELIGFDGSLAMGREEIYSHLQPIFANHPTPPFTCKVKDIRFVGSDTAILRAIAGMVPHGKSDLQPELNAHQTLIAV
jgi:uncharacterized protein (TIGR02246 family)